MTVRRRARRAVTSSDEGRRASAREAIKSASKGKSMSREPENLVLKTLRDIRADLAETKSDLKSDIHSLRADVASDILVVNAKIDASRKELSDQIVGLRRAVVEYIPSLSVTEF
jgi:hypothetical protein